MDNKGVKKLANIIAPVTTTGTTAEANAEFVQEKTALMIATV